MKHNSNIRNGCILDTNILISASTPSDPMSDIVDELLEELHLLKVPVYSNINIRAEFLEIQRKILIPETLVEFYETTDGLEDSLAAKLKSVQTSYRKSFSENKVYKFTDDRIKEFRTLMSKYEINGRTAWSFFCETLLAPGLETVWNDTVEACNLNFIKIREGENHPLLTTKVSWNGVSRLMGHYGIGSGDAMILNLLLSSKIEVVATADSDIRYMADVLSEQGKYVLEI